MPLMPFMSLLPKMMPFSDLHVIGALSCRLLGTSTVPGRPLGASLSEIEIRLPEKPWSRRVEERAVLRLMVIGVCAHAGLHAFVDEPVSAPSH